MAQSRQILPLTSLRFFAGLWIVLFHAAPSYLGNAPFWARNLVFGGYAGVTLFFVLSGFVLTYSYLPKADVITPKRFWLGRFARLYPAYVVGLIMSLPFILAEISNAPDAASRAPLRAALLLTPSLLQSWFPAVATRWNTPAWSLSTVALFYVVFPFVLSWISKRERKSLVRWAAIFLACSLAWPVAYMTFRPDGVASASITTSSLSMNVLKFNPLVRLPEFLFGMVLGRYYLQNGHKGKQWALPLTLISLLLLGFLLIPEIGLPYPLLHNGLLIPVVGTLIYGVALGGSLSRVLSASPFVQIGQASFSVFVLHFPLWVWVNRADQQLGLHWSGSYLFLIGYLVLAFGVSVASYRCIEVPMRKVISRWLGMGSTPSRNSTQRDARNAVRPSLACGD